MNNDAESSIMDFGHSFLPNTNHLHDSDSDPDSDSESNESHPKISMCASRNAVLQTPKKNKARSTPMAPKRGNKISKSKIPDPDAGYEVPEHLIFHIPCISAPSDRVSIGVPPTPAHDITDPPTQNCIIWDSISHPTPSVPLNAFSGPSFTISPISSNVPIQTVNILTSDDIAMCSSPPPYIDPRQAAPYNVFSTPHLTLPPMSSIVNPPPYNIPTPTSLNTSPSAPFNVFSTPCFILPSSLNDTQMRMTPSISSIDIPPSAPFNAFSTPCFTLSSPSPNNPPQVCNTPSPAQASSSTPFNAFSTPCFTLPSPSNNTQTHNTPIAADSPPYTPFNLFSGPSFTLSSSSSNLSTHDPISTTPPRTYTNQASRHIQRPTRRSNNNKDKDIEMRDNTTPSSHRLPRKGDSTAVPPFIRNMYNRNRKSKETETLPHSPKTMTNLQGGPNSNPLTASSLVGNHSINNINGVPQYSMTQSKSYYPPISPNDVIMDDPDPPNPSLLPRESPIASLYLDEDSLCEGRISTSNFYDPEEDFDEPMADPDPDLHPNANINANATPTPTPDSDEQFREHLVLHKLRYLCGSLASSVNGIVSGSGSEVDHHAARFEHLFMAWRNGGSTVAI